MKKESIKGVSYYQNLKLKYLNYAKEAASCGDRVLSEYNLQFAEHYGRLIHGKINQQSQCYPQKQISVETEQLVEETAENKTEKPKPTPLKRKKKTQSSEADLTEETIS